MKKYIVLLFLLVGFLPRFEHGVLTIDVGTKVYAQYYDYEGDDFGCSYCGSYSCSGSCSMNAGCYFCGSYSCDGFCIDPGCSYCGSKYCFGGCRSSVCPSCGSSSCTGGCSMNAGCYFCGSYSCDGSCMDSGCSYCGRKDCFGGCRPSVCPSCGSSSCTGGCSINAGCYFCGSRSCDGSCMDSGCSYCGRKDCFGGCRPSVCPSCGSSSCTGGCSINAGCYFCHSNSCDGSCVDPGCSFCGSKNCFGECKLACLTCGRISCSGNCVGFKCSRCGSSSCSGECRQPICICCLKEICVCNKCSECGKIAQGAQTRSAFSVCEICTSKKCPICGKKHCKEIHDECDSIPNANTIKLGAKSLYDVLKGVTYTYGDKAVPYSKFEELLQTNGSNENSVTLYYYSDVDKYLLKDLTAGDSPYGVETYGGNPSAVATLHTHPNGTPPSGVDLITAAQNANDNPAFSSCYVQTEHGMYSLIIENRANAMSFYEAYKESKALPGDSFMFVKNSTLDEIWNASYEALDAFEDNDRHLLALADLLRISNSGISVVRSAKLDSEFEVVSTRVENKKIVPIKCK